MTVPANGEFSEEQQMETCLPQMYGPADGWRKPNAEIYQLTVLHLLHSYEPKELPSHKNRAAKDSKTTPIGIA